MALSLELQLKDITWLAKAYEEKTEISPFSYINVDGFSEEDKERLQTQGVINEHGRISGTYAPLLGAVAHADSFAAVDLLSGGVQLKASVLAAKEVGVMMTVIDDKLRFTTPPNVSGITSIFADYTGTSPFRTVDLHLKGSCNQVQVFAALCDHYRRQIFAAMAKSEFFGQTGVTVSDLWATLKSDTPHGLMPIVARLSHTEATLDEDGLHSIIQDFIKDGWVEETEGKLYLKGKAAVFAGSFLAIENVMQLKVGSLEEEQLATTKAVFVQAGVQDMVCVEQTPEGLILTTIAPQQALGVLEGVM